MIKYDQKIKTYGRVSEQVQSVLIENEAHLGYELVSSSSNQEKLTVTYRRSKELKFYTRLKDIEDKINKIDNLVNENNLNLTRLYSRIENNLKKERKIAIYVIVMAAIFMIGSPMMMIALGANFLELMAFYWPFMLISVAVIGLGVAWLKLIKKRSDITPYEITRDRLIKQKNLLLNKSRQISKE